MSTCCWGSRSGSCTGSHTLWPKRGRHSVTPAPSTQAQWWLQVTASFTCFSWVSKTSICSTLQFLHPPPWPTIYSSLLLLWPKKGNIGINLSMSRSLHLHSHHPNLSYYYPLPCYALPTDFPAPTPAILQTIHHSANHDISILSDFKDTENGIQTLSPGLSLTPPVHMTCSFLHTGLLAELFTLGPLTNCSLCLKCSVSAVHIGWSLLSFRCGLKYHSSDKPSLTT